MFGLINSVTYWAFITFGLVFMAVVVIGITITDPIAALAGWTFSYLLIIRPVLRRIRPHWPVIRQLMSGFRDTRRTRR